MIFRAVFCDIDGTLLDTSHKVRPATAKAIQTLHAGGVPFIPVSARSPCGILPIQRELGITGPIVCYSGALVVDEKGRSVHSLAVETSRAVEIKRRVRELWPNAVSTVYAHGDWFVDDNTDPRIVLEEKITGVVATQVSPDALSEKTTEAHKIFCVGSPDEILAMEETLARENSDLAVLKSDPRFLEIMHGNATKANALKYLCQAMRLSPADVVAFGDNFNDVDMLEAAGLGVAMGNAPDYVKSRADLVTADNDQEGVLLALNSLNFEKLPNSVRFERALFKK